MVGLNNNPNRSGVLMSRLLIDGDLVVFKAGFAAERAKYHLAIHGNTFPFDKKRDLDQYVKDNQLEDYTIEKERVLEPVENALGNCKNMLADMCARYPAHDYQVFLSGENNFRRLVDPGYKANRDPTHRPHWEPEIKEYIKRYWRGTVADGMEADDMLGIEATRTLEGRNLNREEDVVVSLDKDLKMIPGRHYNWDKKEETFIGRSSAEQNYLMQLVIGDTSDNIPGIDGIGPVKAPDAVFGGNGDYRANIVRLYTEQFGKDKARERYEMNRLLLWICRYEEDIPRGEDIQGIIQGTVAFKRFAEPEISFTGGDPEGFIARLKKPKKRMSNVQRAINGDPVPQMPGNGGGIVPMDARRIEEWQAMIMAQTQQIQGEQLNNAVNPFARGLNEDQEEPL